MVRVGGAMSNIEDRRTEVFFSNPSPRSIQLDFVLRQVAIRSVKGLSDEIFILTGWTILNMSRDHSFRYAYLRLAASFRRFFGFFVHQLLHVTFKCRVTMTNRVFYLECIDSSSDNLVLICGRFPFLLIQSSEF